MRNTAVLLIDCPDRKGLVAAVADLLYRHGANIPHADQHQDHEAGLFFMRVEWELDGFDLDAFREEFEPIAAEFQMRWRLKLISHAHASRSSSRSTCTAWRICCTGNRPANCPARSR